MTSLDFLQAAGQPVRYGTVLLSGSHPDGQRVEPCVCMCACRSNAPKAPDFDSVTLNKHIANASLIQAPILLWL